MIYLQLFWSFLQIGLFSIGGGYAAMPLIQAQIVQKNSWLTMQEFTVLITIAEMTPGPIAINSATFVGIRIAGPVGAICATFGVIFPSCILVSLLSYVYNRYKSLSVLQNILTVLRPAIVALIASAGLSVFLQVMFAGNAVRLQNLNLPHFILFAAAFMALRRWKMSPILVLCLCGICGLALGLL